MYGDGERRQLLMGTVRLPVCDFMVMRQQVCLEPLLAVSVRLAPYCVRFISAAIYQMLIGARIEHVGPNSKTSGRLPHRRGRR